MQPEGVAADLLTGMFGQILASRAVPTIDEMQREIASDPRRYGRNFTRGEILAIYRHFTRQCATTIRDMPINEAA